MLIVAVVIVEGHWARELPRRVGGRLALEFDLTARGYDEQLWMLRTEARILASAGDQAEDSDRLR